MKYSPITIELKNYPILMTIFSIIPQVLKLSLPIRELFPGFFPDDAFYYYKVALNISGGFGSTFDTGQR